MNINEINPGDLVYGNKQHGKKMSVHSVDKTSGVVTCNYFDDKNELHTEEYSAESLFTKWLYVHYNTIVDGKIKAVREMRPLTTAEDVVQGMQSHFGKPTPIPQDPEADPNKFLCDIRLEHGQGVPFNFRMEIKD